MKPADPRRPQRCPWPGCEESRAGGGLCAKHAAMARASSGICPWPSCMQRASSLCYYHSKMAAGLLERSRRTEW
jgi:hypothetical protein